MANGFVLSRSRSPSRQSISFVRSNLKGLNDSTAMYAPSSAALHQASMGERDSSRGGDEGEVVPTGPLAAADGSWKQFGSRSSAWFIVRLPERRHDAPQASALAARRSL